MSQLSDVKTTRSLAAFQVAKGLMNQVENSSTRSEFFSTLAFLLKEQFQYDRLCINLFDQESGRLTLFAEAEGAFISSLSSVRVVGENTVAGKVIASKGPVVITNIARYFSESEIHPLTEAGLSTTMAFPLVINEQVLGTLHCSFHHEPENVYAITEFFMELCPFIATSLGLILTLEQNDLYLPIQDPFEMSENESFIVGSAFMKNLMEEVRIVAQLNIPILILGETGTGKSLLAQHIHRHSTRSASNFVKVNCPALVASLFESELFGHAKGAFTGAANKRIGRFELAHNGTLFLDEIAELSPEMQSKLLHALEDSSFERVGESSALAVDVRLVTATNVNILTALANGTLRPDFYYRLAAYTVHIPPLRERKDDIPPLLIYLGNQLAKNLALPRLKLNNTHKEILVTHSWPGNIREFKNVLQQLLIQQAVHKSIKTHDLEHILNRSKNMYSSPQIQVEEPPISSSLSLQENEKRIIELALQESQGRISGPKGAAKKLGIPRSTLQHRMKKLGII